MQRMHVMLRVNDLAGTTRFYSELFGAEPTVTKDDYAKWMLDDPRVNFSIATAKNAKQATGVEHLGIQAESPEELEALRERISRAHAALPGTTVQEEGQTTCCYANSDKTWVVDAQGVAWEAFHTSGPADTYYAEDAHGACCEDDCCDGTDTVAVREQAAESGCCVTA